MKTNKKWPFILIFILGFGLAMYPIISDFYYRADSEKKLVEFEEQASELNDDELLRRMELAKIYNETIDPSRLADPFSKKEKEARAEYARMLEVEELIGHIEIPKIDVDLPIYAGTSDSILEKGAGHLEGTSLPVGGESTHTVITAHRGLPKAKLFRNLDKLKKGDIFYIHNIQTILAYEVDQILVVDPTNFDPILVEEGKDYATLLTCTPYMINSHRLLVRGHRIDYVPPVNETGNKIEGGVDRLKDLLMFMVPLLLVLIVVSIYNYRNMKDNEKRLEAYEENSEE